MSTPLIQQKRASISENRSPSQASLCPEVTQKDAQRKIPENPAVRAVCAFQGCFVKQEGSTISVHASFCKGWFCDKCKLYQKKKLVSLAMAGKGNIFLTITTKPAYSITTEKSAHDIKRGWRLTRQNMKRKWPGRKWEWLATYERNEQGFAHLHIIINGPHIPQAWISEQMKRHIDAPIVDIRKIRNKRMIANYIAKYIAKDPWRFPGCKRYWRSHGWAILPYLGAKAREKGKTAWTRLRCSVVPIWKSLLNAGFIEALGEGEKVFIWPFERPPPIWYERATDDHFSFQG